MRAQAQGTGSIAPVVVAQTPEHEAAPGRGRADVSHTGTDATFYRNENGPDPQKDNLMQVMTWDEGNEVYLSWDFFDNTNSSPSSNPNDRVNPDARGAIHFSISAANAPNQGPDPDVVLAYEKDPLTNRTELFANLVYIDGDRTIYRVYQWDTSARLFTLYVSPYNTNPRKLSTRQQIVYVIEN